MKSSKLILSALIIFLVFLAIYALVVFLDVRKAKKRRQKYQFSRAVTAFLLLLPATILGFFFVLLPIMYSLGYSFTDYFLTTPEDTEISNPFFKNFIDAFKNIAQGGDLLKAIKNTAIFVVLVVPLQIGLALALALFCHRKIKGNGIFKVCFFAPVVVSLSVTSYLWLEILSGSEDGLMNSFLGLFGVPAQDFLRNENTAMLWIVVISAWQGCGYQMLIFLSALSGIRQDLYEAARMDGCNSFQRFLKVTLPGLKPTLVYVLVTVFIGACRIMVQPMIMLGYTDSGITLSYYMYEQGFTSKYVGYSCAIAFMMTIFIGTITFIQRKILGEKKQ